MSVKKIVVIGPESTGKSTLCEQLAAHYQTVWCPEYARAYLEKNGTTYTYDDLLTIAKGQVESEDLADLQTTLRSSHLFIDTDLYVMKVWCEFAFGRCHSWILNQIAKRKYDLYLLCDVDLPWTKDELREYPDLLTRNKLFHFYKDVLINQDLPWVVISGSYKERLQLAIEAVDNLSNTSLFGRRLD